MLKIYSSYAENNLGDDIKNIIIKLKPKRVIEFGVLNGYSTIRIAQGLRENGEGHITGYDLWEKYPYRHSTIEQARANIRDYVDDEWFTLEQLDFHDWIKDPTEFDLMHLDISNDGDIIEAAYDASPPGAYILFEGGSEERDNIEWMKKYNKRKIQDIKPRVDYLMVNAMFPSISVVQR